MKTKRSTVIAIVVVCLLIAFLLGLAVIVILAMLFSLTLPDQAMLLTTEVP